MLGYTRGFTPEANLVIPAAIWDSPVLEIGRAAFDSSLNDSNRRIQNINIPEGVTHIHTRAFLGSDISSVRIPGSVTFIGGHAFRPFKRYQLRTVIFDSNNTSISIEEDAGQYNG